MARDESIDASANAGVNLSNWRTSPFNEWAFGHVDALIDCAVIEAGDEARVLPETPLSFSDFAWSDDNGQRQDLLDTLRATATDGWVVLHQGSVIHEYYAPGHGPDTRHILMSVTKSVTGLIAGQLVEQGQLDPQARVTDYVPEMAGSAYDNASVRDLLDMRVGLSMEAGQLTAYRQAMGWDPVPEGHERPSQQGFLSHLKAHATGHGGAFSYISANTDLLGWVLERAGGERFARMASEGLWHPMGAAADAQITIDAVGSARTAGGLCATTRDLARLGQLLVDGGQRAGRPIVPADWWHDIQHNGDRDAWNNGEFAAGFPGLPMSYRSGWYVIHGQAPMLFAMGIHGQHLFVDPALELVVAKVSSLAEPSDPVAIGRTLRCVNEIRRSLAHASG